MIESEAKAEPSPQESWPISADPSKYVTLPVEFEDIWFLYQSSLAEFWTVHEVNLKEDSQDFETKFEPEEKDLLLKLMAFLFTFHQIVINKELFLKFINQTEIKEAAYYFGSQADSKKTHRLMYSMLLDELVGDNLQKRDQLISDLLKEPTLRETLKWSIRSTTNERLSYGERLLAFASLQALLVSGPLTTIRWIKMKRLNKSEKFYHMPGLCESNRRICIDEQLNCSFSTLLFKYVDDEMSEERAHEIVRETTELAVQLLIKTLPVSVIGINCVLMKQYIESTADRLLSDIGYSKLYNKENPFSFLEDEEEDAFLKKVSFQNSSAVMTNTSDDVGFTLDADF